MIEGILIGVITASAMIIINSFIRRVGANTRTDRLEQKMEKMMEGQIAILTVLRPTIVAIKGDKHNGDLVHAEQILDEYLIRK